MTSLICKESIKSSRHGMNKLVNIATSIFFHCLKTTSFRA
ncbi:unnamed protein product [Staurois parvus]|uniref:Uncharacterized protein n=1 Tax=Staurois parvus TaxID=386267 RepID=A0ABN9FFV8_9NEOB|nr:unnamed protein product [Staurois parvus]